MIMTNEEMSRNIEILSKLEEQHTLGYAIARNARKMKDAAAEYLNERAKVFQECGKNAGNGKISVDMNVFNERVGEIAKIEHEVDIFQVDEETFLSGSLTSGQMEALLWMVKDENKEDK